MRSSHPHSRRSTRRNASRHGFSLVEVMVALTLLALGMSSLMALSANLVVKARNNSYATARNAILSETVDKLQATQYTLLPATSTSTVTINNAAYTVAITRSIPVSASPYEQFLVTVTPVNATSLARSATVQRYVRGSTCAMNTTTC